jgi:hypothetical protein
LQTFRKKRDALNSTPLAFSFISTIFKSFILPLVQKDIHPFLYKCQSVFVGIMYAEREREIYILKRRTMPTLNYGSWFQTLSKLFLSSTITCKETHSSWNRQMQVDKRSYIAQ